MAGPNPVRIQQVFLGCGTILALLVFATGCKKIDHMYTKVVHGRDGSITGEVPGRLAQVGLSSITTACAHETFANARKGVVAGVTGLHEDVFELRDHVTLSTVAFGLEEAQRLESLLRAEVGTPGREAEESGCVEHFAEYLESLTDPMVEASRIQRQLDASAFNDSSKHAQQELEKEQLLEETKDAVTPGSNTP